MTANKTVFRFRRRVLAASLLSLGAAATAQASFVRNDIDYQYFRDFAENKGQFTPGAKNIDIFNNKGEKIGTMMDNIPMPDLSPVTTNGVATLVAPQYLNSVQHNVGYGAVRFGSQGGNPDAHHFDYRLVDRNDYPTHNQQIQAGQTNRGRLLDPDYHAPRLEKLVTEVAPAVMTDAGLEKGTYANTTRFPLFVRAGGGNQWTRDPVTNQNVHHLERGYKYLTGGGTLKVTGSEYGRLDYNSPIGDTTYGPMATYGAPGDSGSGVWTYDTTRQRWVLVSVLNTYTGENGQKNSGVIVRPDFLLKQLADDAADKVNNTVNNGVFNWSANGNASTLSNPANAQKPYSVLLFDGNLTASDTHKARPSLNHGKSLYFSGQNGTLNLQTDINQGAGALYFDANFTVSGSLPETSWQGAGVDVAAGKTVTWQVRNPRNDRLSKIGAGTLRVNGVGVNEGSISVGDGTVVLAQRGDRAGKQAFSEVGIVSGRPTVVLEDANQVNPDKIYFGFRGGRLDLNGNALTFNRIQNADKGARIVNHNRNKAAAVYLKRRTPAAASQDAYHGYFGEEASSGKTNGRLDVIYRPDNAADVLMFSGGSHLNGNMSVQSGTLLLSGSPVLHARDMKKNADVVRDNEWLDSHFTASNFQVSERGVLQIGRNVPVLKGNLVLSGNGRAVVGYVAGETRQCVRSDFDGKTTCTTPNWNDSTLAQRGAPKIDGSLIVRDHAELTLGHGVSYDRAIAADRRSSLNLAGAHWKMPNNASIGSLGGSKGGQITLNPVSGSPQNYRTLTINGDLSGEMRFNYLTDIASKRGDRVVVNGLASGNHTLAVRNTGREPNHADRLTLLELNHGAQRQSDVNVKLLGENGQNHVDVGALRYTLIADERNHYRLHNPIKEREQAQAAAAAETAKQQEAARKLAEAEAARQNAERLAAQAETAREQAARALAESEAAKARLEAAGRDNAAALQAARAEAQAAAARAQSSEQAAREAQRLADEAKAQRQAAETAKQNAERQLAAARAQTAQAQTAKQTAEQQLAAAQAQTQAAETAKQTAEQKTAEAEAKLRQALADQAAAEQARREAEARLQNQQNGSSQALAEARRQAQEAQHRADEAAARAQAAETEKNQTQAALSEAQKQAEAARRAEQQAQEQARQAQTAQAAAEQARQTAETARAEAERRHQDAQAALNRAEAEKQQLQQSQSADAAALQAARNEAEAARRTAAQSEQAKAAAERAAAEAHSRSQAAQAAQTQAEQAAEQAARRAMAAEEARAQAQAARQQAEDSLSAAQTALSQAQAARAEAEENARRAEAARQQAEQNQNADAAALQAARDAAQAAQTRAEEAQIRARAAEAETARAQAALTEAQTQAQAARQAESEAQARAQDQARQLQAAQAQAQAAETAKNEAQNRLAAAETARDQAQAARHDSETALANTRQVLADTERRLAQAQQDGQEQAKRYEQMLAEERARQAQARQDAERLTKQAEEAQARAEAARDQAERQAAAEAEAKRTAQAAQAAAEEAARQAQAAQAAAETAAAGEVQAARQAAAQAQSEAAQAQSRAQAAETALQRESQARRDSDAARQAAETRAAEAETLRQRAEQTAAEAQRSRDAALTAQAKAEETARAAAQAQARAEAARNRSDAERQAAEQAARQAQAEAAEAGQQAKAAEAQAAEAEKARLQVVAEAADAEARYRRELAAQQQKTQQAEQAKAEADSKLKAQQDAQAKAAAEQAKQQAQQRKQAELVSKYANAALSELSAQADTLLAGGSRLDGLLLKAGQNHDGVWLESDSSRTKKQSDSHRAFSQQRNSLYAGVSQTGKVGIGQLTVGAALGHHRSRQDYDEAGGKGQSTTANVFGKWRFDNGAYLTADAAYGRAENEIRIGGSRSDVKRSLGHAGVGAGGSWQAGGVDVYAQANLRHYRIGKAEYRLREPNDGSEVRVAQGGIGVNAFAAGAGIGKTFTTASGVKITPSVSASYTKTAGEHALTVNGRRFGQRFGHYWTQEGGVAVEAGQWSLSVRGTHAKGNTGGRRVSGGLNVLYRW